MGVAAGEVHAAGVVVHGGGGVGGKTRGEVRVLEDGFVLYERPVGIAGRVRRHSLAVRRHQGSSHATTSASASVTASASEGRASRTMPTGRDPVVRRRWSDDRRVDRENISRTCP